MKGVKLEHVTKTFGAVKGVENVDINVKPGEFFTFLGPSGCGKTTTLRMIAGFYFPSSGKIYFDNQDVTNLKPDKRNIGMVFQNYALFPHMTVFENIAFGLQVRKLSKAEIQEKVERAQKLVHLDGYGHRKITELSGGQQQRVALARALVIEPDILLLDEPLSNLDAKLREETRLEIKRLQVELGVTTIYVTHDQTEAMAMSDRIMVMNKGEVQQIGTPQEIYNKPVNHFVASFIGESNLIDSEIIEVNGNAVTVKIGNGTLLAGNKNNAAPNTDFTKGNKIKLSIRPEVIVQGDGTNSVTGEIQLVEFTGVSINYIVKVASEMIKVMIINKGEKILDRGDSITLRIPEHGIYFIGE
ncbi:iron(III) transport system ATP-binding protein [Bacillus oleivorans]|uniref:Spermidine/putrescine import ATP-binding protein PotA n=1 Tax=Bacillus oleivorans TaxID=1448271 RepID=A0A285CJR5_9BACI|nr:ABC transporter ATP-binding protein [Bacillus oleivorans]SNX67246.1 iron(III) transport system ATP-binding protein [Bacillus oleivorans]